MEVPEGILSVVYLLASFLLLDGVFSIFRRSSPFWLTRQVLRTYLRFQKQIGYLRQLIAGDGLRNRSHGSFSSPALNAVKAVGQAPNALPESGVRLVSRAAIDGQSLVLYGEPGSGKTSVMLAAVRQAAQQAYQVRVVGGVVFLVVAFVLMLAAPWLTILWLTLFPVYEGLFFRAPLPVYLDAAETLRTPGTAQWFEQNLSKRLGGQPVLKENLWLALFVDGVESLQSHQIHGFFDDILSGINRYAKACMIAAVRSNIDLSDIVCSAPEYELLSLDDEGVVQLSAFFAGEANANSERTGSDRYLQTLTEKGLLGEDGIGRNPFWLKLMVSSGQFTRSKGLILHSFCELKLGNALLDGMIDIASVDMIRTALATLSISMHHNRSTGYYSEAEVSQGCDVVRSNLEHTTLSVENCFAIAESAGLLQFEAGKVLRFTHTLFQDYFTAYGMLQFSAGWQFILQKADNIRWWSALFLIGGFIEAHQGSGRIEELTVTLIHEGGTMQHTLAALGILYGFENIPTDLVRTVMDKFERLILDGFEPNGLQAVEHLILLNGYEIIDVFEEMYQSADPHLQVLAAIFLCTAGIPGCDDLLVNKPIQTTLPIFQALGTPAVDYLIYRLESQDDVVCYRVTELLIGIGKPAFEPMARALHHPQPRVRRYITRAIASIGGEEAFQALFLALADDDYDVWKNAANGLIKLGGDSMTLLRRCAEDPTTEANLKQRIQFILSGKTPASEEAQKVDVAHDFDPDTSQITGPSRTMAEPSAIHMLLKPGFRFGSFGRREGRALRQRSYQISNAGTGTRSSTRIGTEHAAQTPQQEAIHFERLGFPPDFEALLVRLGHTDVFVRSAAIEEVRRFGCTLVPYLMKALQTDDKRQIEGVLDALAEVANMNTVAEMRRFRDKVVDPTIRKKADRAIQRMRLRTL
jgi:uncharacterized membrane protein